MGTMKNVLMACPLRCRVVVVLIERREYMGERKFLEITFQQWVCFGVGYMNYGSDIKGTDVEERPRELNFYLPFCMVSFAW